MSVEIINQNTNGVTLQLTINLKGDLPEAEESIRAVLNEAGCQATALAIAGFDTDGSPVMTGSVKMDSPGSLSKSLPNTVWCC